MCTSSCIFDKLTISTEHHSQTTTKEHSVNMVRSPTTIEIYQLGLQIVGRRPKTVNGGLARFKSYYKLHPSHCVLLFSLIKNVMMTGFRPQHLLWSLHFMFNCSTERVMSVTLGTNRETLRKWVWPVIVAIGNLHHIFVSLLLIVFQFS